MRISIIADSSALFSLFIETDTNYKKATIVIRKFATTKSYIIIPGEIFSELINILGKKFGHLRAATVAQSIVETKLFSIENTIHTVRSSALKKFIKQPKKVSFTDCLVMAFADHFETKDIFGFDESFRKNGYTRIGID